MKKLATLVMTLMMLTLLTAAQNRLPSVSVKAASGKQYDIHNCLKDDVPVIISFWSLTCKPCIQELNTLADLYPDWVEEVDFKVVAVSVDDSRNSSKAVGFARGKGWDDFTLLLDANQDLKRAMNVDLIPTMFIVNPKGEIVYHHIGYTPGNEQDLLKALKSMK